VGEYSGDSTGVIIIRRRFAGQQIIIMFKANLASAWSEEERSSRLSAILPMIEEAALRHFNAGQFTNLQTISSKLEDAGLIVLGWGDLIAMGPD
jgi:hypothetical protein